MILFLLDLSTALGRIAVDRDPYSAKLEPKGPSHDRVTRFMNGGALPVISFAHAIVKNHWEIIPGGQNSIAATIRLNRWTGSIDVCSLDAKSVSGSNASGLQLTCEVQKTP